jgi:hypothetical protein
MKGHINGMARIGLSNKVMRKKNLIIALLLFISIGIFYFGWIHGWMSLQKNTETPLQYINNVNVQSNLYNEDKRKLLREFDSLLKQRKEFFHNTSFSESTTQIIIDTILYGPYVKKLGVMIVAKNPTYMQLLPDKDSKWYYNSTCYIGVKYGQTVKLQMIGPTYSNERSLEAASKDIREACFKHFVIEGSDIFKFNLNDERFWQSKIWSHYFGIK